MIAVDVDGAFGTLARLAPKARRCERSLADMLRDSDRLRTAAQLRRYVCTLPSGLHVLASPRDPQAAAGLRPQRFGELMAFVSSFYEVVLLDLGTGVVGPLARLAIERADQLLLASTPEWLTLPSCWSALGELPARAHHRDDEPVAAAARGRARVERRFRAEHSQRAVTIPYDEQLAAMLDSGTYSLEALRRPSRVAIKRLGLAVAERLV